MFHEKDQSDLLLFEAYNFLAGTVSMSIGCEVAARRFEEMGDWGDLFSCET